MAGEDLDAIAAAELINEAKRGAERAKEMGAMGWRKCPLPTANKVFLNNTLLGIIGHSKRHQKDREKISKELNSKINSSSGRDSRKRTHSPHSYHQNRKISRRDRDDKQRDCTLSDRKSDIKKKSSPFQRKHSYSSDSHSSYKEIKHKKKRE